MKMLNSFFLIVTTFLFVVVNSFSQQIKSFDVQKLYANLYQPIGVCDEVYYFVAKKDLGYTSEELTYLAVPFSGKTPTIVEKEKLKWQEWDGKLIHFFIKDEFVYEVYRFIQASVTTKSKVVLFKRNLITTEHVGTPVFVDDMFIFNALVLPSVKFIPGKDGFFLQSEDSKNGKYLLRRYNFELEKLWEKDIAFLFPKDVSSIYKTEYDAENDYVLYVSNLVPKEDDPMFGRTKSITSAILALVKFDKAGEMSAVVPEFEQSLVFAEGEYFYNAVNNSVAAVLKIHEPGKDEFAAPVQTGYAFYEWGMVDGTIITKKIKYFTFGDILDGAGEEFLACQKSGLAYSKDALFPRINVQEMQVQQLEDGSYIILFGRLHTDATDPNYNKNVNEQIVSSAFFLKLSTDGEIIWTAFFGRNVGYYISKKFYIIDDKIVMMHNDHVKNYLSGSYTCTKDEIMHKAMYQAGSCSIINLSDGKVISRNLLENGKESYLEFNPWRSAIDEESNAIIFMSDYRLKTRFGVWRPE